MTKNKLKESKMKKLQNQIKKWLLGALAAIGIGAFLPGVVLAWGPERPTFTLKNPAGYVTFNSITDNPVIGDERNFVRIKEADSNHYQDRIEVKKGKRYIVYAAYHNNAASNLNASGKGIAQNARMRAMVPREIKKGKRKNITVMITANNANPEKVWDEAGLEAIEDVEIEYEADSATIHTTAHDKHGKSVNGQKLKGLLSEKGALLGVNELNGFMPGCAEYSGYVTFAVRTKAQEKPPVPVPVPPTPPKTPKAEGKLEKKVSADGKTFEKEAKVKEGEKVYYRVIFSNIGETELANIKLMDEMAKGMKLVKGSVRVTDGEGKVQVKNFENWESVVVPKLAVGKQIQFDYAAEVINLECGENAYENVFRVEYGWEKAKFPGKLESRAKIMVNKGCEKPPVKPEPTPPAPPEDPVPEIPETGPAEIAIFTVVILGIAGGVGYFVYTKKKLKKAMQGVGIGNGNSAPSTNINLPSEPEKEEQQ